MLELLPMLRSKYLTEEKEENVALTLNPLSDNSFLSWRGEGQMTTRTRLFLTVILVVVALLAGNLLSAVQSGMQAKIATHQFDDSVTTYGFSQYFATANLMMWLWLPALAILVGIWWPRKKRGEVSNMTIADRTKTLVLLVVAAATVGACAGPYKIEQIEEIKTNETAFLVPLEGETKGAQKAFMSKEYLEQAKVATKRVTLPVRQRNTGRAPWAYEWLPTMRVIRVDRTPVTREWTKTTTTGTSPANQAIGVESSDSINFWVGVNTTISVREEDSALFLYNYAGKQLPEIADQNVRGFLTTVLSREFGRRVLTQCRLQKSDVFALAFPETRDHFKTLGVTIDSLGSSEGLEYVDQKIQEAINRNFVAEMKVNEEEQNRLAQEKVNARTVAMAVASRQAAEEFAKAANAQIEKTRLDIEVKNAEARLITAQKYGGGMPTTLIIAGPQSANSGMLFGLTSQLFGQGSPAAQEAAVKK